MAQGAESRPEGPRKGAFAWMVDYYQSANGKKYVMAVTGLILFLYVLAHMIGNLQIYLPDGGRSINEYAAFLHNHEILLWVARTVLLASVLIHIVAALQLALRNRAARPVGYRMQRYREADYASRTMIWSGPIIALFVVYHVLHFTTGSLHPDFRGLHDVRYNVIAGFRSAPASAFYIVAVVMLGMHFYHGLWSWFQTFGWSNPAHNRARRVFAGVMTALVVIGDASIPLMVLAGVLTT